VLLVWVTVQLTGPGSPVPNPVLVKQEAPAPMAAVPRRAPAPPAGPAALPTGELEEFVPVTLEEGAALPAEDVDVSAWDLDSELAGMTDREKEVFLKRMHQR